MSAMMEKIIALSNVLRKIAEATRPFVRSIAALLRYAPRMWRWELVSRLASDLGVTAMAVQTADGLILSKVEDLTVLPWLARERNFGKTLYELTGEVRQILSEGGVYLDIGANIGVTTLTLASEKAILIHAFEPDPTNFQMLTANLAINRPQHTVSLHQIALSDQNGTLAFELNPNNPADNRLAGSGHAAMGENRWKRIDVQVRRLDDVVGHILGPIVAKIDAEGSEAKIIAGGYQTLSRAGLITFEWYPYLLARAGGDPEPALCLVADFQRASMVVGDRGYPTVWQTGPEVAARMRSALLESKNPWLYYEVQARRT
jgi:FkbM family methyltransferase